MTARFAIEEGLIDAEDVYSDYDESEVEHSMELEMLERMHPEVNPAIAWQYYLEKDFPEFQDDTCKAILQHVCEHDSDDEGICCRTKRRRIMEDAEPLLEAWKSGYRLKNAFKKDKLPRHFKHVCLFLGLDMTELS